MEREVGGGIGMGNTCKSMADSFQCMTKPTTIKKKKNDKISNHLLKLDSPFLPTVDKKFRRGSFQKTGFSKTNESRSNNFEDLKDRRN